MSVTASWGRKEVWHIKQGQAVITNLSRSCQNLEKLLLFFNEIDKTGAGLVPEMLSNKFNLQALELNGNTFEGEGPQAQAIRDKLRSMNKLDVLDELDEMESEEEESDKESESVEQDKDDLGAIAEKVGNIQI